MKFLSIILMTLVLAALASPAAAADFFVPASWSGVWSFDDTDRDCDTNEIVDFNTSTDTLCTGEQINFGDDEVTFDCTGTLTDTNIDLTCTGTFDAGGGCTGTITITLVGTRTGDTMNLTETVNATFTGVDCFADFCEKIESVGTRTGPEAGCTVPVELSSWGNIKALYP